MNAVLPGSRVSFSGSIQFLKILFKWIDQGELSDFNLDVIPNAKTDVVKTSFVLSKLTFGMSRFLQLLVT